MNRKLFENQEIRRRTIGLAQLALSTYSLSLGMKQKAANTASLYLKEINKRDNRQVVNQPLPAADEKENNMKHLLAGLAAVAAAGALLGAAGYAAHRYATKKKDEYEDLMYTDEMGEDFIIYEDEEDTAEKYAGAAADVKDTVVSAAENVKDTVADAFSDIKEVIEGVMEK